MKKLATLVFSFIFLTGVASVQAQTTTNQADAQVIAQYETDMQAQVQHAQQKVAQLQQELASRETVQTFAKVAEYENAVQMLEVKRTLVNNFTGTVSLHSALVRQVLMGILQKDLILPSDLAYLQNTVNTEKARLNAAQPPAAPVITPTTPSTPTTTGQ